MDLDSVRDDLAAVMQKALEPAHISVWIRADERHLRGTRELGGDRSARKDCTFMIFGTPGTRSLPGGAGIKDLMARMGHDSERAAMIYQHEARGADQTITNAIDRHVQAEQRGDDSLAGALVPVS